PGAAASPIVDDQANDQEADDADAADADDRHARMSRRSTTNYELDHRITHTKYTPGSVRRLSVAVVVDYRASKQDDGSTRQVPLDDRTMDEIKALTRQAMGFSTQRGDSLTVVNASFTGTPKAPDTSDSHHIQWLPLAMQLGRYLLILIVLVLL